jgi:protein involved in polysaccharide export with SLBB domain
LGERSACGLDLAGWCSRFWLFLFVLLAGCEVDNNRSFQMKMGDTERTYLDEATPEQQAAAVASITNGLQLGVQTYHLKPGDQVEVLYKIDNRNLRPYRIGIGDELEIDFQFDRSLNRQVVVRPDGMVSLPGKGEIRALEIRPLDLASQIATRYADIAQAPVVTVSVRKFVTSADQLADVVRTGADGRGRVAVVRPDGIVDLPMATGIRAAGMTPAELQDHLDQQYARTVGGVTTTVRVTGIAANQIFVFGEVKTPGPVPANSPRTLLQAVALAGGPLPTGAIDQVRVVYFDAVGRPTLRRVNLEEVMASLRVDQDLIVPPNSTIYVPPTALTKAARIIDTFMKQILQFNGITIGITPFIFTSY